MTEFRVAIIDSGIDLKKLYGGDRHGYEAVWVPVEDFSLATTSGCNLLIIPAGSDNITLAAKKDCLRHFLNQGGWVFSFDGVAEGLIDGVRWVHSKTDYKRQAFRVVETEYAFLLDGVSLEGLACKDGVRGWWCEGELLGDGQTPLMMDDEGRIVACIRPPREGAGAVVATAAARLPIFSTQRDLPTNVFFKNILEFCRASRSHSEGRNSVHLYIHSGNWSHRAFLNSEQFGSQFTGVHWGCLDEGGVENARSIWIPWESNTRVLKHLWPVLERAVANGAALVVEDMRDNWLPGFRWEQRPVDSSWWREKRELDLVIRPEVEQVFPSLSPQAFRWHYHGVLDCPIDAVPLLTTRDGKVVLAYFHPRDHLGGIKLISTLDATFEYGVGKIRETARYIQGVLDCLNSIRVTSTTLRDRLG